MDILRYKRHGFILFSALAVLFALVSTGCYQSNKSRIIGSWRSQSIDTTDKNVQYTLIKFYKEGLVSKKDVILINDEASRKSNKIIGKYKFNDDKNSIKITWDNGDSEILDVSFPQKNRLLLGKDVMEKID